MSTTNNNKFEKEKWYFTGEPVWRSANPDGNKPIIKEIKVSKKEKIGWFRKLLNWLKMGFGIKFY